MASPNVDVSTGWTLSLPVSGATFQVEDPTPPARTVEDVPTSHQGTTTLATYIPSDIGEGGELGLSAHFNPDTDPDDFVGVVETAAVLTSPAGATWTMGGYVKGYTPGTMTLNQKMLTDIVFKVSGDIVVVAAA